MLRAPLCAAVVVAMLVAPAAQAAGSFTVVQPAPDAVASVQPAFELAGAGIPSNEVVSVRIASDAAVDARGALALLAPPAGGSAQLFARTPTSNTWSGTFETPLRPGSYFWQFSYPEPPCVDTDPPTGACDPPANATCSFGECFSSVQSFSIVADTTAPLISALGAKVRLAPTRLTYRVVEPTTTIVVLRLTRRGTTPWQAKLAAQHYDPAATYFAPWTPRVRGDYRYCASATDVVGNASLTSCRWVHVS